MKFGSNLSHLSVPEWRAYNIDYNQLKLVIRLLSTGCDELALLAPFQAALDENFDYVKLFIHTKVGEVERKLAYLYHMFQTVVGEYDDELVVALVASDHLAGSDSGWEPHQRRRFLLKLDAIIYQVIALSQTLNHLFKYTVLQRIATKKIFKKFLKYYPCTAKAAAFVNEMKAKVVADDPLFITFDFRPLNYKVALFICELRAQQRVVDKRRRRCSLVFTVDFAGTHPQQVPPTPDSLFDLAVLIKKNFRVDFLVSDAAVSDVVLNMNVYLNCEPTETSRDPANHHRTSFIFLFNNLDDEPLYIISREDEDLSTLVIYTGGLRKYSYCILPNTILQKLLDYIAGAGDGDTIKQELYEYFLVLKISPLTRTAIDTMLSKQLVPKHKLVMRRQRYYLSNQMAVADDICEDTGDLDEAVLVALWLNYKDDYLLLLDLELYTTNHGEMVLRLCFPTDDQVAGHFDRFPHNHLAVHTSDLQLSTFDNLLTTEVLKEGNVRLRYLEQALRRLPAPLQTLVENTGVVIYKLLSFHHYMLLCYSNVVPSPNNHYLRLLKLNLLKKAENVEVFTTQLRQETGIIKARSDRIIRRQISMGNLTETMEPGGRGGLVVLNALSPLAVFDHGAVADEEPGYDTNDTEDLMVEMDAKDTFSVLLGLRGSRLLATNQLVVQLMRWNLSWDRYQPLPFLVDCCPLMYGLIDEEQDFLLPNNYYVRRFEHDYDRTLLYLYFAIGFLAMFVAAIGVGMAYLVFEMADGGLFVSDNLWIVVIMMFGMVLSMILLTLAVKWLMLRFWPPPSLHQFVVWGSLTVVINCCLWLVLIISKHIA